MTDLDLNTNNLTTLPSSIGKLINLNSLNSNSNKLDTLPSEIGKLTKLMYLYLGTNNLINLPTEIGHLYNLRELYLGYNKLTGFYTLTGELPKLTYLSLVKNAISENEQENIKKRMLKCQVVFVEDKVQILRSKIQSESDLTQRIALRSILVDSLSMHCLNSNERISKYYVAQECNSLAWDQLNSGLFIDAEKSLIKGITTFPQYLFFFPYMKSNLCTSLLLQGKYEIAEKEILMLKDIPCDNYYPTFKDAFLDAFQQLEEVDIIPKERKEDIERIKQLLKF